MGRQCAAVALRFRLGRWLWHAGWRVPGAGAWGAALLGETALGAVRTAEPEVAPSAPKANSNFSSIKKGARVNQCAGPGCRILLVAERAVDQVLIRDDEYKRNTAWVLSRCASRFRIPTARAGKS